jgi:hypothetical protein
MSPVKDVFLSDVLPSQWYHLVRGKKGKGKGERDQGKCEAAKKDGEDRGILLRFRFLFRAEIGGATVIQYGL